MAFSSYKSIGAVVKEFQVKYTEADFIVETEFNIPDYFRMFRQCELQLDEKLAA